MLCDDIMRCFIAVDLPADIRRQIRSVQVQFEKLGNLGLVNPDIFHSTLLFLGDLDSAKIKDAKKIGDGIEAIE